MTDTRTIGSMARQCGVSASLLRFWEAEGLLPAVTRTESGYRAYDTEAEARVRFIQRAQALGLSLEEVRQLLDAADGHGGDAAVRDRLRHLVAHKLAETERRVTELSDLAGQLERVWVRLGEAARCECAHLGSCDCLPPSVQAAGHRQLVAELAVVTDGGCQCQIAGACALEA
ncbi:MAG: MerR family transcriptional regulator [Candidatus Dormibacteria bacterium]